MIEDLLVDMVKLWADLRAVYDSWTKNVLSGKTEYDDDYDVSLKELFARYARLSKNISEETLPFFESHFEDVDHADKFRRCKETVDSLLANDIEGETLLNLKQITPSHEELLRAANGRTIPGEWFDE